MSKKEELEVKKNEALATIDFQADAGQGMEGADKDSFAIPFLLVLQPMSPVVVDENVPGAKPGLIMNSVSQMLHKELIVIPVAYQRRVIVWGPRDAGGGFRGIHMVSDYEQMLADKIVFRSEADGKMVDKDGNTYRDTRHHFVLVEEDGTWIRALMALSSTQIKRSKRWMTAILQFQMKTAQGTAFNPPSYARMFKVGPTEKESNDKGTWFSWTISPLDLVKDANVYQMAKKYHSEIVENKVKVDHNQEKAGGDEEDVEKKGKKGF